MEVKLAALILFTARIESVVAFYRTLGLPLEIESHEEGGLLHYAADLDGMHIAIYEANGGDGIRWREGGCTWPGFTVDDVDAVLERLLASGAKILSGPEDRPWGRRVVVEDPDGRPVELW